jgi:hypothetical protein
VAVDRRVPPVATSGRKPARKISESTAKVEIDYLKVTGQDSSKFLETPPDANVKHLGAEGLPNGIVGITRHALR